MQTVTEAQRMSVDSAANSTLRVADHFPKVLAPCESVAAAFFHCFTENSRQVSGAVSARNGRKHF
jgi:hypothetical protein